MQKAITRDHFHGLTRPLIGLPVSRIWRSIGSTIIFELGHSKEQRLFKDGSTHFLNEGESAIMLEWSWRVEQADSILFGSLSETEEITDKLEALQGLTVVDVMVEGRLAEIVVQFSDDYWVRSFTALEGQPRWCLFLNRMEAQRRWVTSASGLVHLSETASQV